MHFSDEALIDLTVIVLIASAMLVGGALLAEALTEGCLRVWRRFRPRRILVDTRPNVPRVAREMPPDPGERDVPDPRSASIDGAEPRP